MELDQPLLLGELAKSEYIAHRFKRVMQRHFLLPFLFFKSPQGWGGKRWKKKKRPKPKYEAEVRRALLHFEKKKHYHKNTTTMMIHRIENTHSLPFTSSVSN